MTSKRFVSIGDPTPASPCTCHRRDCSAYELSSNGLALAGSMSVLTITTSSATLPSSSSASIARVCMVRPSPKTMACVNCGFAGSASAGLSTVRDLDHRAADARAFDGHVSSGSHRQCHRYRRQRRAAVSASAAMAAFFGLSRCGSRRYDHRIGPVCHHHFDGRQRRTETVDRRLQASPVRV